MTRQQIVQLENSVKAHFVANGIEKKCPSCGSKSFSARQFQEKYGSYDYQHMWVTTVVCSRCLHIRVFFDINPVDETPLH